MTKVEENEVAREESPLDAIARSGAQRMLMAALQMEVDEYVQQERVGAVAAALFARSFDGRFSAGAAGASR